MMKNNIKYKVTLIIAILFLSVSLPLFALNYNIVNSEAIENKGENLRISDGAPQYIDSINIWSGTSGPGSLSNTHVDDGLYKQINSELFIVAQTINIFLGFNPALAGKDFRLSLHVTSSKSVAKVGLYVNGNQYGDRQTDLVLTNVPLTAVNSITLSGASPIANPQSFNFKIDYFEIVEIVDSTPYETNEEHALGGLPGDDWDWYYAPDSIQVVDAASYQVAMAGKAIKMSCEKNLGDGDPMMTRTQSTTFEEGDSLLLSFKSQINKALVPIGVIVEINGASGNLLRVTFRTWLGNDRQRIEIDIADGRTYFYDTTVNKTIDIDIFMFREPSNRVKYFMCIEDALLYDPEVTTVVGPVVYISVDVHKAWQANGATEDFFLDDLYLGSGSSYEIDAVPTHLTLVRPMYYLFHPEIIGTEFVERASLKFEFSEVDQEWFTFGIKPGFGYGDVVEAYLEIPLIELVDETENRFEEGTNGEDLIIYFRLEADAKGITLTFPGTVPKEIIGLAEFIFEPWGNHKIESLPKTIFVTTWPEALPDEYNDYKQEALSGTSQMMTFETPGGGKEQVEIIETRLEQIHGSFVVDLFFFTCSWETFNEITAKVKLEISWIIGTPPDEIAYFNAFKGTGAEYSTTLNLPPIHAKQLLGLSTTAGPGQGEISLSWDNVSNYDYYNIYRDGVKIATSTSNSYIDTGLAPSATYTYYITVNYLGEENDPSISVSETTLPPVVPATPAIYLIMILSFGIFGIIINRKSKRSKKD